MSKQLSSNYFKDGQKQCVQCGTLFTPRKETDLCCKLSCSQQRERDRARQKRRVQMPDDPQTKGSKRSGDRRALAVVMAAVYDTEREVINAACKTRPLRAGESLYTKIGTKVTERDEDAHE